MCIRYSFSSSFRIGSFAVFTPHISTFPCAITDLLSESHPSVSINMMLLIAEAYAVSYQIKKILLLDIWQILRYLSHLSARFWIWVSNLAISLFARPSFLYTTFSKRFAACLLYTSNQSYSMFLCEQ